MRSVKGEVSMWISPSGRGGSETCFFFFVYTAAVAVEGLALGCCGVGLLPCTLAAEMRFRGLSKLGAG